MHHFLVVTVFFTILIAGVLSLKCYECDDEGVSATLDTCDANGTIVECTETSHKCSHRVLTFDYNGKLSYTVNKGCVEEKFSGDAFCTFIKKDPKVSYCKVTICDKSYCNGNPPTTGSPTKESPMSGGTNSPGGPGVSTKSPCEVNSGNFLSSTKQATLFCLIGLVVNIIVHRL